MTETGWKAGRDRDAADRSAHAAALVGLTIAAAEVVPHDEQADCVNVLELTTTDGRKFRIEGGYGGYTGHSCDEYIEVISVSEVTDV